MKRRAAGAGVGAWACTALEPVGDTCTLREKTPFGRTANSPPMLTSPVVTVVRPTVQRSRDAPEGPYVAAAPALQYSYPGQSRTPLKHRFTIHASAGYTTLSQYAR